MSVRDRQREMALLKLVGFDSARVSDLVLAEISILGAAASLLGVGAALVIFSTTGITISVEGFTMVPHLPADLAVIALLTGVILSLIGAWLPVHTAASRPIALALRGVD
jgi:putative ABC transport system permease protein